MTSSRRAYKLLFALQVPRAMALQLSSILLCLYTLLTCVLFVGLIYWIDPDALGVCAPT